MPTSFDTGVASRRLSLDMAIPHASPVDVIDVRPLGPRLAGAQTTTLFKTHAVEVLRMVLEAGKEVPPHAVPREVLVQCLEGRVEVRTHERRAVLEAGQMLYLAGSQEHALVAAASSSLLVTILLEHKAPEPTR
jgi:quercetin dioxygenase-like cupin family protein